MILHMIIFFFCFLLKQIPDCATPYGSEQTKGNFLPALIDISTVIRNALI